MSKLLQLSAALFAAVIGGILLVSLPLRAAGPTPIACPNGRSVNLEGQAPPRESLLIYLRGRPVGGGLADSAGRYSLPLRAQERPGIYPVEVRLRSSRTIVATYTCFVDVPLDATQPASATTGPTSPPITRATPTAPVAAPTKVAGTPTAAATSSPTRTAQPTASPSGTAATPTAGTPTPSATLGPGTPSPTAASTAGVSSGVEINDIVLRDPQFPDTTEEYVQIRNRGSAAVTMTGWRLINTSKIPTLTYTFPAFTLGVDVTIAVFTAAGEDDVEAGDFYWDQSSDIWQVGQLAELRSAQNTLVATLTVPNQ